MDEILKGELKKEDNHNLILETLERKAEEYNLITKVTQEKQDKLVRHYIKQLTKEDIIEYQKYWQYYCQRRGE